MLPTADESEDQLSPSACPSTAEAAPPKTTPTRGLSAADRHGPREKEAEDGRRRRKGAVEEHTHRGTMKVRSQASVSIHRSVSVLNTEMWLWRQRGVRCINFTEV